MGRPLFGHAFGPLRHPTFRSLWIATFLANLGHWAQVVGVTWLLVEAAARPDTVALVQTASAAPVLLFSMLAGTLADLHERRSMQLAAQAWILGNAAFLAALAASAAATPLLVLLLTFAVGIGIALRGPAWQASIRDLVPDEQVPAAVTLSSAGFNLSRALGPVLGGVLVAAVGATGAFAFHVLVSLGLLGVLLAVPRTPAQQPAQSVRGALASGVGYVLSTPVLRSVLVRAAAIGVPASATLALLPVFATEQLGGGPVVYGALLGCFGAGAIVGAVVLPALRRWLSAEDLVSAAIAVSAGSLAALAAGPDALLAGVALLGGGVAWIAMLSTLNIAVQFTAAAPLRGRALAAYMTCAFGGLAVGSALWGALAARFGLSVSLLAAAATLACGAALRLWFALPADQR